MKEKFTILTIEDNEPDFLLLKKALKKIKKLTLEIINIYNGEEALDFIYKRNQFAEAPTPDLIILDLNLPIISGYEVLNKLKNNKKTKIIPVIIYSTSDEPYDIITSYSMYANSYITKTFDIKKLFNKIATLGNYWLKTSKIPNKEILSRYKKEGK